VKVRVWVRKSRIAGLGLFAAQHIRQGTRILPYVGEKISKAESTRRLAQGNVYIFTFNERYDIDGTVLRNTARYSNHSCDPNCEITKTTRTIWLMALRDIADGEELTYNYGYAYHPADYKDFPCGAGVLGTASEARQAIAWLRGWPCPTIHPQGRTSACVVHP
jgi:SET domain-containing protein